ncbi:MAG: cytochrome c1, partial [Gammaproteobacteria bacterium]|nr:cytochrome c1 [Gammaproteobacteria bacterium]
KRGDPLALQNGAKIFVNYCLGCHSAEFVRYNKLTEIGLSEEQIKTHFIFNPDTKLTSPIKSSMNARQARDWFGTEPPDLSLIARSRASSQGSGASYLYTFLRSFYADPSRITGANNLIFPNVAMPNVLWELQGTRVPQFQKVIMHGQEASVFKEWKSLNSGTLSPQEFDNALVDLVSFLDWLSNPDKDAHYRLGLWVVGFMVLLVFVTWRLNKAYWKDIA